MTTRVLEGTAGVVEAARLLEEGQVVALPTETVYGLAGHALDAEAAARIFEAKERPRFDPLIVHLPSMDWLERLTTEAGNGTVRALAERFWPGPLTLVLPRRPVVPEIVTSGLPTVAVRMSAHPVFRGVLERFGRPVAAPSANRFGRISPTAAAHVLEELGGRIPLIVDGGACGIGIESTVVALRPDGRLEVLRQGPVPEEVLAEFAPVVHGERPGAVQAPGQMESHYAPGTPLKLLGSAAEAECWRGPAPAGLLAWRRVERPAQFAAMEVLAPSGSPVEGAARLFAAMRRLDGLGLAVMVAEPPPGGAGLAPAILDRLQKASGRA